MEQIRPIGSVRAGRVEAARPAATAGETPNPPSRALVVIAGGRADEAPPVASFRDGRAEAGFLTQLLVGQDPTLKTSRPLRTRQAAARYAEMARLFG